MEVEEDLNFGVRKDSTSPRVNLDSTNMNPEVTLNSQLVATSHLGEDASVKRVNQDSIGAEARILGVNL